MTSVAADSGVAGNHGSDQSQGTKAVNAAAGCASSVTARCGAISDYRVTIDDAILHS
jgi:hypothetical protein